MPEKETCKSALDEARTKCGSSTHPGNLKEQKKPEGSPIVSDESQFYK